MDSKTTITMESLFHLTSKECLPSIMQQGLLPSNGKKCSNVDDDRTGIFLCREEDISKWEILLRQQVLLKITGIKNHTADEYCYSHYSEYVLHEHVPPKKIEIVTDCAESLITKDDMMILCKSYLATLSWFTVMCARVYSGDTSTSYNQDDIYYQAKSLTAVLKNLDYDIADSQVWADILTADGEDGQYTFCDTYCPTETKLWQKLIEWAPDRTYDMRKEIYTFIKTTFPFSAVLCTGGYGV